MNDDSECEVGQAAGRERSLTATSEINAERASRRGYIVFATDPDIAPERPGYRQIYATEAKTPSQALAKIRPIAGDRRLRAYLMTGRYRDELAEARWVA